uniref:Uncharacterized protein n=1 Tax=Panagrolaimus sp. PS1159 TaxID=55785 RepID=A0AC35FF38_9BILA
MSASFRSPKKTSELEPSLIQQIEEYVQASVNKHFAGLDGKIDGIFEVVNKLDETTRSELREIKSLLNHSKSEATTPKSPETPDLLQKQPPPFSFDASPKDAQPTIGKTRLLASSDMSSPKEPINSAENGSHLSDFVFDSSNPVKPGEANYVSEFESVSEELPPATKSSSDTAAANSDIDYNDEASNKSIDDVRGFFCYSNSTPKRKEKPEKKLPESPSTPHASPLEPLKEREKESEKLVENVVEEIGKEGDYCSDDAISDSNGSFSSTQQNLPFVVTHCSLDNENESIDSDTEDEKYSTQKHCYCQ